MNFFHQRNMNIDKILNNTRMLKALTGLTKNEFLDLLVTFKQIWFEEANKKKRKRNVGGGRKGNIKDPQQKLFYILFYIKAYPTFDVAAFIFASSKTSTNRWTLEYLPLLEKVLKRKIVLPKKQIKSIDEFYSSFPGVKEVMIDGVERPIQRPKKDKNQRKNYSGKKKRHTRKNTIITDEKKNILYISPTKAGSIHDKRILDKENILTKIPPDVSILADTGYQGIDKYHPHVLLPKKKSKHNPLSNDDRAMNRLISSYRILVENAIAGMKRYNCLVQPLRNKRGIDDIFVRVCAGLWNFHLKMSY